MGSSEYASLGRMYGNGSAHDEVAYAVPLFTRYSPALEQKKFSPQRIVELQTCDARLLEEERTLSRKEAAATDLTARLQATLKQDAGRISDVYLIACEAFEAQAPAQLESFPARAGNSNNVASMTTCLAATIAYVDLHGAALEAAGGSPELSRELETRMNALAELNQAQAAAEQEAVTAQAAVYETRGRIYHICRSGYRTGREAFRSEPESAGRFKFQYMRKKPGKGASTAGAGASEEAPAPSDPSSSETAARKSPASGASRAKSPPAAPPSAPVPAEPPRVGADQPAQ